MARSEGMSAVEFALIAPVLFFSLIATADMGLALNERMTIDHILRAGAQSAMRDLGPDAVLDVMTGAAATNFVVADAATVDTLSLSADRFYACPEALDVPVPPATACAGSASTVAFYRLEGSKIYGSWMLPDMTFRPLIQVQVR